MTNTNELIAMLSGSHDFPTTITLSAEEIRENKKRMEEFEAKKLAEKRAKAEKEEAKAKAMGLSLAEYKAKKNKERNIKRVEREIAELEAELEAKRAYLLKLKG